MNIKKRRRGQSLIELIMVLPLFIGFWAAMVWFAEAIVIQIELLHTARHGVFWLVYQADSTVSGKSEEGRVRQECYDFLHEQAPSIDLNKVIIDVQTGDRWKPSSLGLIKAIPEFLILGKGYASRKWIGHLAGVDPDAQPASLTVHYTLNAPPLLQLIPGFPPTIPLRGYCVCYR